MTETNETKIEQIVKGIDGLSEEDYTSTGIPRVEALEAITGIAEITGDERDEAWKKYQAENPAKEMESPEDAEDAEAPLDTPPDPLVDDTEREGDKPDKPEESAEIAEVAKATEPKEDTIEAPYVVAEGKAITSRKGILGPGKAVFPKYFGSNGDAIIKKLEEDGMVVAT